MKPDGTGLDPLTDPGTYTAMDWFPDGKRLLLTKGRIVKGMRFVRHCTMGLDGSGIQAYGIEECLNHSRMSPDGRRIAFTSNKDHPTLYPECDRDEVYVMDVGGANLLRLTHNMVLDATPTWTPDGRILFSRGVDTWAQHYHLFAIEPDGTRETSYPPLGPVVDAAWPAFSPDGLRISFARYEGPWYYGRWDLWVMDADGAHQTRLTAMGGVGGSPSWSPDSRQIVFSAHHQLHIIAADGSSGLRPEPLSLGLGPMEAAFWEPVPAGT